MSNRESHLKSPGTTKTGKAGDAIDVGDGLWGQDNPSPARGGPLASLQDDVIVATARYWGRYAGHMLAEPMRIVRQRDSEMKPDIVNE